MTAITLTARWRPHDEVPVNKLETALIAVPPGEHDDPDAGATLLPGIYYWREHCWRHEGTGETLTAAIFYWLPEEEILAPLDVFLKGDKP
jgi:hypothetical protein